MKLMDDPLLVLFLSFLLLFLAAQLGDQLRKRVLPLKEEERDDYGVVLGATLTLLGLLIGFAFSMAVSRYDQRKNYEEAEANAIGTEYVRADLLPANYASRVRELLRKLSDMGHSLGYIRRSSISMCSNIPSACSCGRIPTT